MKELYKRLRPKTLEGIIGQEGAKASLARLMDEDKVPHAILLTGPSGSGKTTIARIIKRRLNCGDPDFYEINSADFKGIDTIREIRRSVNLSPISGDCRVWLIDECHKLTGDAQNALLKLLEDGPDHAYFMLATTDPHKVIKTVLTRCSEVRLSALSPLDIEKVIRRAIGHEQGKLDDDVVEEIVTAADGSARKALVILEQVLPLSGRDAQIQAVQSSSINKEEAIKLARLLISPRSSWDEVATVLRGLNDDPEGVRHLVLAYSRSVLLGGGPLAKRAFMLIDIFARNFYDSKAAGLAAACWEAIRGQG